MTPERTEEMHTHWSLVRRAHSAGMPESADEAWQQLVMHYAPAVRKYVGSILRHTPDAEELAHDVIVRLLRGDFAGADTNQPRFRDLLKTAICNMVRHHWENRDVRKGIDPDLERIEATDPADDEWQRIWQATVVDHAWAILKEAEEGKQGLPAYTALKVRTLHPEDSSEQLAARLSAITGTVVRADASRQMLRRARVQFAEALVAEIRIGLDDPTEDQLHAELASLDLLEYLQDRVPIGRLS
jgi:DNA-directed RNA polymerase specialized sigma24 family protein